MIHSPPALSFLSFFFSFFFFQYRLGRAHEFHFFFKGQDQSRVAQRAETIVAGCSLTSGVGARFPGRYPHYPWTV